MADPNFFPGFEGDDEPKPAKSAPPPASAAPKPAFDPFADAPPPQPTQPAAAPTRPGTARPAGPPAAAAASADEDAEIKPGARKDLWKCPHCGAGNKPDRTTCRTCGKSPQEPVVVPWHRNSTVRAGLIGIVGLVVVLAVWLSRVDLTLREAGPEAVDDRPRIAGSARGAIEVSGDVRFVGEQQISVSGRVVASKRSHGLTWVALALGPWARSQERFTEVRAADDGPGYAPDAAYVVLACILDGESEFAPGTWLSLAGQTGSLNKDAAKWRDAAGAIAVRVDEVRTAAP